MIWCFPESVVLTPVDGEAVLLNTATGNSYVLNSLGVAIAALIEERQDTETITNQLCQKFPEQASQIPQDLSDFLAGLQAEGLLHGMEQHADPLN